MRRLILAALMAVAAGGAVAWAQASANEPRHPHSLASPPARATLTEATIKALQAALNKQGIVLKVDGVLNNETRAAIRKYQSQHQFPVTGEPDSATLEKLGVRQTSSTPTETGERP
jgi:peptidoglycan hydrolase-like protein with peptidoglycan-binding domain